MKLKKLFITTISTLFLATYTHAAELTFSIDPFVLFPGYTDGNAKFNNLAGGGLLNAGVNLFDFMNVGVQGGYFMLEKANAELLDPSSPTILSAIPVGGQLGFYFYPLSRLQLYAGAGAGACLMSVGDKKHNSPYYNLQAQVGFRINPSFTIGINGSYLAVQNNTYIGNPGIAGLSAGIEAKFQINTSKNKEKINTKVEVADSVFPLMHKMYKSNSIGTITIKNTETAQINNVKVSFVCEGFTASQIECGSVKKIRRYKKESFELYADFNENIKQFTEEGKIPGQVIVEYELLGQKRTSITPISIPVYNRNSMNWIDAANLACFVSSGSSEILELSKYLVGIGRNKLRTGVNRNMQFAVYMFEGLRLYGVEYVQDSETPYNESHLDYARLDSIQYPFQTMAYKSGDVDEIGVLLMSLLESVGIPTGFIPCNDDFIVVVDLDLAANKVGTMFSHEDSVIVLDDYAYLPLSMKNISKGFIGSWEAAVKTINDAVADDEYLDFISVEEAWMDYPSAGFSENIGTIVKPAQDTLISSSEESMEKYIAKEFNPLIDDLNSQIAKQGSTPELLNKLGMVYVRSGQLKKAISVFEQSAAKNNASAMVNIGNVLSLQQDYKLAKTWYEKALAINPENKSAQRGLDNVIAELEK